MLKHLFKKTPSNSYIKIEMPAKKGKGPAGGAEGNVAQMQ